MKTIRIIFLISLLSFNAACDELEAILIGLEVTAEVIHIADHIDHLDDEEEDCVYYDFEYDEYVYDEDLCYYEEEYS